VQGRLLIRGKQQAVEMLQSSGADNQEGLFYELAFGQSHMLILLVYIKQYFPMKPIPFVNHNTIEATNHFKQLTNILKR
jgi:hypothetical protein